MKKTIYVVIFDGNDLINENENRQEFDTVKKAEKYVQDIAKKYGYFEEYQEYIVEEGLEGVITFNDWLYNNCDLMPNVEAVKIDI